MKNKDLVRYIYSLFCIGTVLVPTRPLPRTTVTHVHQATKSPPDIYLELWCQPEKKLEVLPPTDLDCSPVHTLKIISEPPQQDIVPKVEADSVKEVDAREYRPVYDSALVDRHRISDAVSRILRSENIDENIVSHSIV